MTLTLKGEVISPTKPAKIPAAGVSPLNHPADKADYDVFILRGIPYVPHYTEQGIYVPPGERGCMTAGHLEKLGARKERWHLLTRTWAA